MAELAYLSISQAHELLKSRTVSAAELTRYYLDRLKQLDNKLKTSLTLCADRALDQARAVDTKLAAGKDIDLLEGIPYTAKDMFLTRGIRTTAASRILDNFIPPYSATVIEKLDAAGAILLGKVNQDEFAHGSSTENSAYQVTRNPWDESRVPGGSSGGSAAAVAADFGIFSLGTDTGGSIRQPASYCGVVGLKPTYGLVSRYGVVAMASSLDVIGPLTRSVEDAAIVLEVVAGQDPRDSTTIKADIYSYRSTTEQVAGKKVGIVREYVQTLDGAAKQQFEAACTVLKEAGAELGDVSLPHVEHALPAYYIVTPSEISSNLSRYDGIRYGYSDDQASNLEQTYFNSRGQGFGPEVKRRVLTGTYALSAGYYDAYYKKAMQLRTLIKESFIQAFEQFDVIISPTTPAPAFPIGQKANDPVAMYLEDIMTVGVNLAGNCAISVPAGEIDGLPVGLQIMAPQTGEQTMFAVARSYEAATDWKTQRVPL